MAVYVVVICGMIWDNPGMLRLVGLFCALTSLYVAERDRVDIMFGGMLWWATKAKSVWFIISFQSWTQCEWPGGLALGGLGLNNGRSAEGIVSALSGVVHSAQTCSRLSFQRNVHSKDGRASRSARPVLHSGFFFCFFLKNPLWMLHDWVEISRCFLQMWANVKCSSSDLKCISWKFTKEQNCQRTKPDQ